jgi:tetratricopeptide (TPR) repeat protein
MLSADPAGEAPARRHREARALFERLLDLPAAERAAALHAARADAPGAAADAEALLEAHGRADSLFDTPAAVPLEPPPNLEGRLLGAYRLVRRVGEGGMGEVYEALRTDAAFDQRVAVKVIRGGAGSRALVERFQQERQILAALEHPGITRITGGGVTDEGSPYLVMDFVAGVPIDRHCRERGLGEAARLGLFERVCEAVRHAHHHLVVHRDIKPANILVTEGGGVKLLDFGIAKVLSGDRTLPATGSLLLMTPDYASPEQILGRTVTTATDVYLLGVLLYELLTDRHPHRRAGMPTHEVMRAVCEDDPAPPSAVRKGLASDLGHIALKALAREPARRYATVDALLDDLFRYRHRWPVLARRPTVVYRGLRFVQRHRGAVAAAALVSIALAGGLTAALWQARVASAQATRAEAAKRLLADVFRHAEAGEAGRALSAREAIDLGAQRVEAELRGQPDLQAEMSALLGQVYTGLGAYDRAEPLLRRAVALRRAGAGDDLQLADALDAYGTFLARRNGEEAERTLRDVLALRERSLGPAHPAVGMALNHLADVVSERGRYAEARAGYERALAVQRRALGPDHRDVADSLEGLAENYASEGEPERTAQLHEEALAMRRRVLGDLHPDVLRSLYACAVSRFDHGEYSASEALFREALAAGRRVLEPDHPENLRALHGLGTVLAHQSRHAEAEPILREVVAARSRRFGPRTPELVDALRSLGSTVLKQGRLAEAEPIFRDAVSIAEEVHGTAHHEVAKVVNDLGLAVAAGGDWGRAASLHRRSRDILLAAVGPDHPHVGRATASLAADLLEQGDVAGAERSYDEALRILRAKLPPGHDITALAELGLGRVRLRQGRPREAEVLLRAAHGVLLGKRGSANPDTALAVAELAASLPPSRRAEALPLLRDSRDGLRAARGEGDPLVRRLSATLARMGPG